MHAGTIAAFTWIFALLMRLGVIPGEVSGRLSLHGLMMMCASGLGLLFQQPMTMGYEGHMVLGYIMSGRRISRIQRMRVRGACALLIPAAAFVDVVAGALLGCGILDILTGAAVGACGCSACACIEGYCAIRGTSYFNDMDAPRTSSRFISQVSRTMLEVLFLAAAALTDYLPGGGLAPAAAYCAACGLAILLSIRSIRKGDTKFYGEYQSIAA
jgi:hypothetical protein